MKPETRIRREQEKQDRETRQALLENPAFHQFLKYLHSNAREVLAFGAAAWLPGWIVTGCELYFTDVDGKVKEIVKR